MNAVPLYDERPSLNLPVVSTNVLLLSIGLKVRFIYLAKFVTACCFSQLAVTSAFAQVDTANRLNEVFIIRNKAPERPNLVPAQSISNASFIRPNALNVADAVRNFAGVNVRDYGGIGGLKTVSVRGMGANYTGVLYDGILMNDAQTGQIDLGRFYLNGVGEITLYNAQPDDILTPARSFSSAAILAITPSRPAVEANRPTKIVAGVTAGSFGLLNPYLQLQQRLSDRTSFVLNTYKVDADGKYRFHYKANFLDTTGTRTNSDVSARQIDGTLYHSFSDSSNLHVQFYYYQNERGSPDAVIAYASYAAQRLFNEDMFAQAVYSKSWSQRWRLLLNTKLSHNFTHYTDSSFLNNRGGANEHYTQRELYQSAALAYQLNRNVELSYSSDLSLADVDIDVYRYAFPTRLQLYNVFAANVKAGRFILQGNLLHIFINDNTEAGISAQSQSALSPTAIVNYRLGKGNVWMLRAYFKRLYRYPNLTEQYFYATQPRVIKPERANLFNLGGVYNKTLDGKLNYLNISVDAYYNHLNDKILITPGRAADILSVRNIGKVNIYGADVTMHTMYRYSANWKTALSASYTFQKALDATDASYGYYNEQIPYTPVSSASASLNTFYKTWGFNYNLNYSGKRYYLSNNKPEYALPAFAVSDISFTKELQLFKGTILAALEANNLFNKDYVVVNSYPMPPRSYRFSLKLTL